MLSVYVYSLLDQANSTLYQGYSWRSEIPQIRIRLRLAESTLPILQITNAFAKF